MPMKLSWKKNKGNCPCQGCEDRHIPCHDKCERYQVWLAGERDKELALRADRDINRTLRTIEHNGVVRIMRGDKR